MSNALLTPATTEQSLTRRDECDQDPPYVFSDTLSVELPSGNKYGIPVQLCVMSPFAWQELNDEDLEVESRTSINNRSASTSYYYKWNLFHGRPCEDHMRESMTEVIITISPFQSWYCLSDFDPSWEPPYCSEPFSIVISEYGLSHKEDGSPYYGHQATETIQRRLSWGDLSDDIYLGSPAGEKRCRRLSLAHLPRRRGFCIDELYGGFAISLSPILYHHRRSWENRCTLPHALIRRGFSNRPLLSPTPAEWVWTDPVRTQDIGYQKS